MVAMGSVRIAAILLIFTLRGLEAQKCPPASEILPCTCRSSDPFIVKCSVGASSVASIGHMINKQFSVKYLVDVTLAHVQESSLKAGSFEEISIDIFVIENSPMVKDVEENFFEPMAKEVKGLRFETTSLTSIPAVAISKLKILRSLTFDESKITQILKKDIERLPKSISAFFLTDSLLSYIEEGAFASVAHWHAIYLSGNQLKSLPSGNFLRGRHIRLAMHRNQFSQVPFDRFSLLSKSIVQIGDSKIRVFPSESTALKKFFESGNRLDLKGSEIDCTCDMKWVATFEPFAQRHRVLTAKCWDRTEKKDKDVQRMVAADFSKC